MIQALNNNQIDFCIINLPHSLDYSRFVCRNLCAERFLAAMPENGVTRIYLQGQFWGMAVRRENQLAWRAQIPPREPGEAPVQEKEPGSSPEP